MLLHFVSLTAVKALVVKQASTWVFYSLCLYNRVTEKRIGRAIISMDVKTDECGWLNGGG